MFRTSRVVPILVVLSLLVGLAMIGGCSVAASSHREQAIRATAPDTAIAQPMAASDVVYTTRTGKCYHAGSCKCLAKSKIKTTRGAAEKQGLRACKLCRP